MRGRGDGLKDLCAAVSKLSHQYRFANRAVSAPEPVLGQLQGQLYKSIGTDPQRFDGIFAKMIKFQCPEMDLRNMVVKLIQGFYNKSHDPIVGFETQFPGGPGRLA